MTDHDDKDIEAMQKEMKNILNTITSKRRDTLNTNHEAYLQFSIKVEECNDPQTSQPNNASKTYRPRKSDVENILIDKNSIKTITGYTMDLNSCGTLNIKDEDDDVEEYINNNKEIDEMEIYRNVVNEIVTKVGNKEIEKQRSTDKLNDNRIDIKLNFNVKENDRRSLHSLEKETIENNSNVNDLDNANEIEIKEEINDEFNEVDIILPQENSLTNITDDAVSNSDVENENNVYYEEDSEMVFDDSRENNGTDKKHLEMLENKLNDSNQEKNEPETPGLREFIAMLLDMPSTNHDTVSQDRYLLWCKMCSKEFDRPSNCKRHFIQHLLDDAYINVVLNKGLRCQICGEVFYKNSTYKSHMRYHASLPVYKCELCNKSFSDSSNLTKHKMVHKKPIHTSDVCQKKFKLKHQMVKHLEKHETTKSIVCNVEDCNRVFYDQNSYIRHCRQEHLRQDTQYTCLICRQRFITLKDKWDHQRTNHMPEKPIACDVGLKACSSQ